MAKTPIKSYIASLLVSIPLLLAGQINESDTSLFHLELTSSGFAQSGNVNFMSLRNNLEILFNGNKDWVLKTQNQSLYQAFGGVKADNDLYSRNFLYWRPQKRAYPFLMAFAQGNFRRKIALRYFAGPGYTFQLVRSSHSSVKLSAALVFEDTDFERAGFSNSAYNGDSRIQLFRATAYVSGRHQISRGKLNLSYSAYVQPSLDGLANTRAEASLGLGFQIFKKLIGRILYRFAYEQVVVEGVQRTDRILTAGLSYSLQK